MPRPVYRLASDTTRRRFGLEQVVLGPGAVLGDPLQVDPLVGGQRPAALGQLLLGEQARLDPLGQLDLLLGVEQRDLADLLQVVLDRVRGRARHRDLRGGQVIVVVAEDEDLLVLAAAVRGDLDHPRARAPRDPRPRLRCRPPPRPARARARRLSGPSASATSSSPATSATSDTSGRAPPGRPRRARPGCPRRPRRSRRASRSPSASSSALSSRPPRRPDLTAARLASASACSSEPCSGSGVRDRPPQPSDPRRPWAAGPASWGASALRS